MYVRNSVTLSCLFRCLLLLFGAKPWTVIAELPNLGNQNAESHYEMYRTPVFQCDFEDGESCLEISLGEGEVTSESPISGQYSLRLTGEEGTLVTISPEKLGLYPNQIYVIEISYRGGIAPAIVQGFQWDGIDFNHPINVLGPFQSEGIFRRQIRVGGENAVAFIYGLGGQNLYLDDINIWRHGANVVPAEAEPLTAGFPRLANYNIGSVFATGWRNGLTDPDELVERMSLYHLLNGGELDFTSNRDAEVFELKERNPNQILLPYFQTFVAQLEGNSSLGGVAGLRELFNESLTDEWFMKDANGERLNEPLYPQNFQLNHTEEAPSHEGERFEDFVARYLGSSVLPSGLWNGIHFDQSEWYVNPLLTDEDPYNGNGPPVLPEIDLDGDGVAESKGELFAAWEKGFSNYFDRLREELGGQSLFFGNAGDLPKKPSVLSRMNGMQREFTMPYPEDVYGDWDTEHGTGWYELMDKYRFAEDHLQLPQLPSFQFTGANLGIPTGGVTANGLPDRFPLLESRDFRRMRFGLATTLMGNGFFGYDLVDNTTYPQWFDEFAIDADGNPVESLDGVGWLGQPLGDSSEVGYDFEVVFWHGFEDNISTETDGLVFHPSTQLTESPNEVVNGSKSLVMEIGNPAQESTILFSTEGQGLQLEEGETYHLFASYRILNYEPIEYRGGLLSAITDDLSTLDAELDVAAVWYPDIGQSGTLRSMAKVDSSGFVAFATALEPGKIALDDIGLLKGSGGVYRRDFENGIVLVNPTEKEAYVSQEDLEGPLSRTGVRRLSGVQDPEANNGESVNYGLSLPSGDGILLLADPIVAGAPEAIFEAPDFVWLENKAEVYWPEAGGTVAGYIVQYGLAGGDLTRVKMVAQPRVELGDLEGGSFYNVSVRAFDFSGNEAAASPVSVIEVPGDPISRPQCQSVPEMILPGLPLFVDGSGLADGEYYQAEAPYPDELGGVQLFVNGIAAPLVFVGPEKIVAYVPWSVGAGRAVIRAERDGLSSASHETTVVLALPEVLTWPDSEVGLVYHADPVAPVTVENPALPGEKVLLFAKQLGPLEPPPLDGYPVSSGHPLRVLPHVWIGEELAEVSGAMNSSGDTYFVEVQIPSGLEAGFASVEVLAFDRVSNKVWIPVGSL